MEFHRRSSFAVILLLGAVLLGFSACTAKPTSTPTATLASPTPTLFITETPTQVPEELAAIVNGKGIPLALFESEVVRYKLSIESLGEPVPSDEDAQAIVLQDLIEQTILAQAAQEAGFVVTDELLQERITRLAEDMGGQDKLDTWMLEQSYTQADFEAALRLSIAVAWQRDAIIATVPLAAEQVRAHQIFAYTPEGAQRALISLRSGIDFEELAWEFRPETGGELGWFPRGYLLIPAVEEAAFALAIGQYSDIIESDIGYHIVMVVDREMERPLAPDALLTLQRSALTTWIEAQLAIAQIEILTP